MSMMAVAGGLAGATADTNASEARRTRLRKVATEEACSIPEVADALGTFAPQDPDSAANVDPAGLPEMRQGRGPGRPDNA
jgi:hypothetical protein